MVSMDDAPEPATARPAKKIRNWFRLTAITPDDVPWHTRISIRIRTWIWLRRVEWKIWRALRDG